MRVQEVNEELIQLIHEYNYDLYKEIKNVPDSEFNINLNAWVFKKQYIDTLTTYLEDVNILLDVGNNRNIDKIKQVAYEKKDDSLIPKTVKVTVVKENSKSIVISFDFDYGVLNIIKTIEQVNRKYDKDARTWMIRKEEIEWLYSKLKELKYVDVSSLEKYLSRNSDAKISPKDFPNMKRKPHDYQIHVANEMLKYKKIINSLEAGLGKTMISVMVTEKIGDKTIIVCPATVKENWKKEILLVNPDADVCVLDGRKQFENAHYIILNYDILDKFYDDIINDDYNIVIFDEAHRLRGVTGRGQPSSKRAKFGIKLAEKMEYVYPLTATPFINKTKDIFNLLKMIKHPSSSNWYAFANTYCGATRTRFGTSYEGSSNEEKLYERLYPTGIIRLLAKDHLDLPELVRSFIPIKINLTRYEKKIQEYLNERDSYETNGQHLVMLSAARKILAEEKVKHAVEFAKDLLEQGESVVIMSNYTDVVNEIANRFKDDAVVITGDVSSKQRQKAVDLFQSGEKKVFVGNADASGEGITLTRSRHMIVVDMHWSPIFMSKQLEKRINRMGQTGIANVYYLYAIGAKVDEMMAKMAEEKLSNASLALDGREETFIDDLIEFL